MRSSGKGEAKVVTNGDAVTFARATRGAVFL